MSRAHPLLESHAFYAARPGPDLLFFGAIHGNETCGTYALQKTIAQLRDGTLKLEKGSVTFVPIANPAAFAKNSRYVQENLNRIFKPAKQPKSIEARLANQLCRLVDRCDVLLDIHSTTAKGQPFIYLDYPTRRNRALAQTLGPSLAVVGWPQLYKKFGKKHLSFDTPTYAAAQGKDCVLVECGQHEDPAAITVAVQAILQTMRHYGVIKGKAKAQKLQEVKIYAGFFRNSMDDKLAKEWRHLDPVGKGDILIRHGDGSATIASRQAYIIMPKMTAAVGDDWLYLGQ